MTELFSEYRRTPLVCFFLHNAIRIETDHILLDELTFLMSFYRYHEDRLYAKENAVPQELADLAAKCISGFQIPEIVKMLSIIDSDNGVARGSQGQTIAIQLREIDDIISKLHLIAEYRHLNNNVRFYAIAILVNFLGDRDSNYFKNLLKPE